MNEYRKLEMQAKTNSLKEEYKYFVGTTIKNPLEYKIGEKIVFKIRVKYMDDYLDIPYISYSLIGDDGKAEDGYLKPSEDGWFYIETSVSKSGFVYIKATACDEEKNPISGIEIYNGSAGAGIEDVSCSDKTPEDYHEFWNKLKEKVEETEPEVLFCEKIEDEKYPDFDIYDMRIKVPGSDYVSAMVTCPKGAEKGSLKFAMYFQGYGVWQTVYNVIDGFFTVWVNAHSIPNRETPGFYNDMRDNKLKGYGFDADENKNPETTYWAKMFLRNLQALRYFKDNELLNKKDYHFVGSSQGGMQACNMAAHFEKASAVIMNVPWLSDINGHEINGRRENGMPKGRGVTYFDTAIAAQFLKCPAYIISGLGDCTCHSSTQMALYNAVKSRKYHEFYQNKVHSYTIPWDRNLYTLGDTSLAEEFGEHTHIYYNYN